MVGPWLTQPVKMHAMVGFYVVGCHLNPAGPSVLLTFAICHAWRLLKVLADLLMWAFLAVCLCRLGLQLGWVVHSRLSQAPSEIQIKLSLLIFLPSGCAAPSPGCWTFCWTSCAQMVLSFHLLISAGILYPKPGIPHSATLSTMLTLLAGAFDLGPGSSWVPPVTFPTLT